MQLLFELHRLAKAFVVLLVASMIRVYDNLIFAKRGFTFSHSILIVYK
jgi:hypothetical protein